MGTGPNSAADPTTTMRAAKPISSRVPISWTVPFVLFSMYCAALAGGVRPAAWNTTAGLIEFSAANNPSRSPRSALMYRSAGQP